jgi:hypothetical protein
MWDNTYLTKDKNFNGLVLFHSTDGVFVNGWRYTNGKVTHTVDVKFDEGIGISLKSGYYDCDIYDIFGWFMDCTINSWNVTSGEVSVNNIETNCGNPYIEHVGTVYQCTYVDEGTGTGGTYNGSSQQSNLSQQLKNIFTNVSNFSDVAISKLNSAFEEINRNCRLKKITTYLEINDIKLGTVSIDENLGLGKASFTSSDNLKFVGDWAIDAENLSHEWFHVGQKKMNNVSNATDGYAEFEAWLFFDIQETIRVGGNFSSSNHKFACYANNYGNSEPSKIPYQNWLLSITENGTTFPSSLGSQFYYWGPIFAQVRNYSHLSFTNTSYYTKTMFDIKNCN